ncbi:MAG TPA: hypothetical protein VFY67_09630 [Pyrinomonadaceae bacterium]|nr:hypothetical protein [Pyrinomonadaceae bacterium]
MREKYEDLNHKLTNILIHEPARMSGEARNALESVEHLSQHTTIDGIADLEVTKESTFIEGKGYLEIERQHGSSSDVYGDKGLVAPDAYPIKFKLLVDSNNEIEQVLELEIDTNKFYE